MKKLIAILMIVCMATLAFAGGWSNLFNGTYLTVSTIDDYIRIPCWDETNGNRVELEMGVLDDHMGVLFGSVISLDTAVVLAEATSSGTYSIAIESTEFLLLDWLFVEDGADTTDYYAIATADTNGTDLDTLNLITSGRRTNTYFFNPTQDTTLYIVRGDTMSVDPKVVVRQMVFAK